MLTRYDFIDINVSIFHLIVRTFVIGNHLQIACLWEWLHRNKQKIKETDDG